MDQVFVRKWQMSSACWDVAGFLPAPASKQNCGSADLLEDQLFAYGSGSGVVVAEVRSLRLAHDAGFVTLQTPQAQQLQLSVVLQGGHRGAVVTAVKWCAVLPVCREVEFGRSNQNSQMKLPKTRLQKRSAGT